MVIRVKFKTKEQNQDSEITIEDEASCAPLVETNSLHLINFRHGSKNIAMALCEVLRVTKAQHLEFSDTMTANAAKDRMTHVFEALETNANVKFLKITWHLSIAETAALSKLIEKNTLLSLDATNCKIINNTEPLIKALETNTSIRVLKLSKSTLGKYVGSVLRVNKSIKGLSVISEFKTEKIEDGDLEDFKAAFESNTTLKMLEFQDNKLGNWTNEVIWQALSKNSTLTSLNLAYNQIWTSVFMGLGSIANSALLHLFLDGNAIGEALPIITKLLPSELKTLSLVDCALLDRDAMELIENLKQTFPSLTHFDIFDNRFAIETVEAAFEMLAKSNTLKYMGLSAPPTPDRELCWLSLLEQNHCLTSFSFTWRSKLIYQRAKEHFERNTAIANQIRFKTIILAAPS